MGGKGCAQSRKAWLAQTPMLKMTQNPTSTPTPSQIHLHPGAGMACLSCGNLTIRAALKGTKNKDRCTKPHGACLRKNVLHTVAAVSEQACEDGHAQLVV